MRWRSRCCSRAAWTTTCGGGSSRRPTSWPSCRTTRRSSRSTTPRSRPTVARSSSWSTARVPGLAERYRAGAHLRARGAAHRHPAGVGRRDRAPGGHPAPRHQACERADHGLRLARADRLRHRRDHGPRGRCDRRHVDPVVAAGAARRAPDGRRALGRLLARRDDLLAAGRAHTVRGRRRAEHRAAAGLPHRALAAAPDRSRRRAVGAAGRCSSARWPSTRRAGSRRPRPSRAHCSRWRPTCGCRSRRWT